MTTWPRWQEPVRWYPLPALLTPSPHRPLSSAAKGIVTGTCVKLFSIAGPVLVFGISASAIYGLIYWLSTSVFSVPPDFFFVGAARAPCRGAQCELCALQVNRSPSSRVRPGGRTLYGSGYQNPKAGLHSLSLHAHAPGEDRALPYRRWVGNLDPEMGNAVAMQG